MTRTFTRRLLLVLIALVAPAALAQPCTTSWTNAAGGAWAVDLNWDNGAPGASDVACITLDGTYAVAASGFSVDVLRLGGASGTQTLTNSGNIALATSGEITANGDFDWVAGYLSGGTLTNAGGIRLTGGSGTRGLNGATLRNEGTIEHADTGAFYVYGGARVENATTWTVTNSGNLNGTTGAGTFVNEATGTLTKTGPGQTLFSGGSIVLENAGTIDVQEGAFRFDRPSTHTDATLTTASGATLEFNSGGVTFVGTISGAQGGALILDNAFTAGAGAEWAFTGTGIEWTSNYLTSGTLTNSGPIRLTGASGSRGVNGADTVLRNEGTIEHADTGAFYVYLGARVENATTWTVTNSGDLNGTTGAGTFVNEATGTLTKTGPGQTLLSGGGIVLENAGTIDVQEGAFRFDRPSTHTDATLTTASGATLEFNSGGVTFVGTISGAQGGALILDNAFTAGAGAEWAFTGTGIEWTSNYLTSGTLTNSGPIRLTGASGSRGVNGADTVLRNEGTIEHADTGAFYVYLGARVENATTWTVTNSGDLNGTTGAGTFVNEATGTLTKTGPGQTLLSGGGIVLENAGTIDVQEGAFRFDRPSTHTDATLTTASGATLEFNSGGVTFVGTQSGAQAGTLTLDDVVTAGAGAEWAFTGTGIEWTTDYLASGALTNTGLLRLTGSTGSRGVRGPTTELHNQGTVEHAGTGSFYVYDGGRVENAAVWSVADAGDYLGSTGGGTFVNTGRFIKTGLGTTSFSGGGIVFENSGVIGVNEGEIDVDRPFDHQVGGIIRGGGIFDATSSSPFVNEGATRPGLSPGRLTWQGNWTASAETRLRIGIGGLTPDTEHAQLAVAGTATLGGTLRAFFGNGFSPTAGQTFTIVTCSTACTGTFDTVELPLGVQGTVDVNPNDVVLTVTGVDLAASIFDPSESVVVGPEGGSFRIKILISNPEGGALSTQTWTTITKPDESTREIQAAIPLNIDAGGTARRATLIVLDSEAPEGTYTYRRYIGTQGVDTLATAVYTFEKTGLMSLTLMPVAEATAEAGETTVVITADGFRVDNEEAVQERTLSVRDVADTAAPTETALLAPYPNPALYRATVAYDLAETAPVRVTVIDAVGRVVAVLVDETAAAGRHLVPFDTSRLAPGLYVVTLTTGTAHAVQRMTVVR